MKLKIIQELSIQLRVAKDITTRTFEMADCPEETSVSYSWISISQHAATKR